MWIMELIITRTFLLDKVGENKIQSNPDNSNLHGKEKTVRVIGSSSYRG